MTNTIGTIDAPKTVQPTTALLDTVRGKYRE